VCVHISSCPYGKSHLAFNTSQLGGRRERLDGEGVGEKQSVASDQAVNTPKVVVKTPSVAEGVVGAEVEWASKGLLLTVHLVDEGERDDGLVCAPTGRPFGTGPRGSFHLLDSGIRP